jgi:Zn-dependent protease
MTLLTDAATPSLPAHATAEPSFTPPTSSVPLVPLPAVPASDRASEQPARFGRLGPILAAAGFVALKLLKAAKAVKILLFGAFIWSLALNHPLPFALALAYAILVHESGHLLAMKWCGLKTTGIWFLPFLGAAAVAKQRFRSYGEEFFIAIAGPVFGLASLVPLFAAAALLPGGADSTAAWFGYASTAALVNLFNLLPIGILDGGRIVKSLASSLSRVLGFIVVGGGLLLCAILVGWIGGAVLGAILGISIIELLRSRKREDLPPMSRGAVVGGTAAYAGLFAVLAVLAVFGSNLGRGLGPF